MSNIRNKVTENFNRNVEPLVTGSKNVSSNKYLQRICRKFILRKDENLSENLDVGESNNQEPNLNEKNKDDGKQNTKQSKLTTKLQKLTDRVQQNWNKNFNEVFVKTVSSALKKNIAKDSKNNEGSGPCDPTTEAINNGFYVNENLG